MSKTGTTLEHPKYGLMELIEYKNWKDCSVLFHRTGTVVKVQHRAFYELSLADPTQQLVFGVGKSYSELYPIRVGKKKAPQYVAWENMLMRCYYPKTSRYSAYGGIGVKVCDEWLSYENFAKWYDDNNYIDGYHLDKDLLGDGGIYSPETCNYIPQRLNGLFVVNHKNVGRVNNHLPTGVAVQRSSFVTRINHEVIPKTKSFTSVEEAHKDYLTRKWNSVREIATEMYRWTEISEKVYDAVLDRCYKEQELLRTVYL